MGRETFLNELRIALQGNIPQAKVNEHLRYYENYIIEESRKGSSEEEVLKKLGNPRLIAKTIIEAEGINNNSKSKDSTDTYNQKELKNKYSKNKLNRMLILIILLAIILLLLITRIVLFLLPILVPVIVIIIVFCLSKSQK